MNDGVRDPVTALTDAELRDEKLRREVVMLDLSRHTETLFSKMDALDRTTFNILGW